MNAKRLFGSAERTDPTNPAEAPILARQMAAYIQAMDLCVGRRVVEIGCGRGAGTALLAQVAKTVIAIDYDPACIERNREEARNDAIMFVVAEVPPLPPAALGVDVIVCFQMIEHIADPQPLFRAMRDALVPGGVALITTPNADETLSPNPYHLHEFTGPELQQALEMVFDAVTLFSVVGDDAFQRYWEANRAYVQRAMRLDPLGLNRYLPTRLKRRLFDAASRLTRARLRSDALAGSDEITAENFRFERGLVVGALDFYAICQRGNE